VFARFYRQTDRSGVSGGRKTTTFNPARRSEELRLDTSPVAPKRVPDSIGLMRNRASIMMTTVDGNFAVTLV
jgi:hypothetical protein